MAPTTMVPTPRTTVNSPAPTLQAETTVVFPTPFCQVSESRPFGLYDS
jgi:hypothetical protein